MAEDSAKYPLTDILNAYKDMVLPAKLVKPFKTFGYIGKISQVTLLEFLTWLYDEKNWQLIITDKKKQFAYHVESTVEGGIKFYDSFVKSIEDAITGGLKQAAIACNATEGSDYYFPKD